MQSTDAKKMPPSKAEAFLPCDPMHKRGLCRRAVSVSVYVCVCHVRNLCQKK